MGPNSRKVAFPAASPTRRSPGRIPDEQGALEQQACATTVIKETEPIDQIKIFEILDLSQAPLTRANPLPKRTCSLAHASI